MKNKIALKTVSLFLCISIAIIILPITSIKVHAANNNHSQTEAVKWVSERLNTTVGDGWCPALAWAYYEYLGHSDKAGGDGKQYQYNVPDGWKKIPYSAGVVAEPGDVAVWDKTTSDAGAIHGHVAIVKSADEFNMTIFEQGKSCGFKVKENTIRYGQ